MVAGSGIRPGAGYLLSLSRIGAAFRDELSTCAYCFSRNGAMAAATLSTSSFGVS